MVSIMKKQRAILKKFTIRVLFSISIMLSITFSTILKAKDYLPKDENFKFLNNTSSLDLKKFDTLFFETTPMVVTLGSGVYLQKPFNGAGSPVIRGVSGLRVPVIIDGVRYSNSTYTNSPNQYLATISPHILKKVSISTILKSCQPGPK